MLIRQPPLRLLNSDVYIDGRRSDALQVRLYAESAEATHFWAAVLLLPYIALAGLSGRWRVNAWLSLAQPLVNVYPPLQLHYAPRLLHRHLPRRQFTNQVLTIPNRRAHLPPRRRPHRYTHQPYP